MRNRGGGNYIKHTHLDQALLRGVVNGDAIDTLQPETAVEVAPLTDLVLFTLVPHILDEEYSVGEHERVLLKTLDVAEQVVMRVAGVPSGGRDGDDHDERAWVNDR